MNRKTIPLNMVILHALKPDLQNNHLKNSKHPGYKVLEAACYQEWFLTPGDGTGESRINN